MTHNPVIAAQNRSETSAQPCIHISPEFGYVILAVAGTFPLNMWQMMKIGGKRKELGIQVSVGIFKK